MISSVLTPKGSVLSATRGADVRGPWVTLREWELDRALTATQVRHRLAYEGASILIAGCGSTKGCTPDEECNGHYLLQPPYDDVSGRPHYILLETARERKAGSPLRRHLFYNPEINRWQISPVCNDSEGALSVSLTPELTGAWCRCSHLSPRNHHPA